VIADCAVAPAVSYRVGYLSAWVPGARKPRTAKEYHKNRIEKWLFVCAIKP
jgi:hypothetical protein